MAAYFGDEEAKKILVTREIVYLSKDGIERKKANLSSKEGIIKDLMLLAECKMYWDFYRSAKKIFKFVLSIDQSNDSALNGFLKCDINIDN